MFAFLDAAATGDVEPTVWKAQQIAKLILVFHPAFTLLPCCHTLRRDAELLPRTGEVCSACGTLSGSCLDAVWN